MTVSQSGRPVAATDVAVRRAIEVIYLGGTIGMVDSERGWKASDYSLSRIEALLAAGAPGATVRVTAPWPPRDSAQLGPSDWEALVPIVSAAQRTADGVVIVQGTDTLAFTSSWLALTAPGSAPVVVTGAQTPLAVGGHGSADAADNLTLAARAALGLGGGTWVAFGDRVLPGFGVTKTTTLSPHGFDTPTPGQTLAGRGHHGASPLAGRLAAVAGRPVIRALDTIRTPVAAVHPGFTGTDLMALAGSGCAGLVLEAYGAGSVPLVGTGLEDAVRALTAQGSAVVVTSRCQGGRVNLERYATGQRLAEAGAIDGQGLTSEAAQVAVCYLAATGLEPPQIRAVLGGPDKGVARRPPLNKIGVNND
jgi:L-asparaginase